jgi:hypothetical protein
MLRRYNWFEEHIVTGSIIKFNNESDDLDNFIKRLRTEKSSLS